MDGISLQSVVDLVYPKMQTAYVVNPAEANTFNVKTYVKITRDNVDYLVLFVQRQILREDKLGADLEYLMRSIAESIENIRNLYKVGGSDNSLLKIID